MFNWIKKYISFHGHHSGSPAAADKSALPLPSHLIDKCTALKKLGDKYFEEGKLDDAVKSYQKAISLYPSFAEAYNNLGNAYSELRQFDEAERCLRHAINIQPDLSNAHINLGSLLRQKGRHAEAVIFLSKALELKSDMEILYHDLADALIHAWKSEEAKQVIAKGIKYNPNYIDFHVLLGNIHLNEKEFDQAIACYQHALLIRPEYVEVISNLGNIFLIQGKLDEALQYSRTIIKLNPGMMDLHFSVALAFQQQMYPIKAIACYQEILEANPKLAEAHFRLGNILKTQGKPKEANTCYQAAISIKPDFAEAYYMYGSILQEQESWDDALACYQKAISIDPEYVYPLLSMGNIHKMQGRLGEAMTCYQKALVIKPDFAGAHSNMGVLFQERGKWDQAIDCYKKALAHDPRLLDTRCNLGILLAQTERSDEAISCFRQVLELEPEHYSAQTNLLRELQKICKWENWESGILSLRHAVLTDNVTAHNRIDPFAFLALPGVTASEQRKCSQNLVTRLFNPLKEISNNLAFHHKRSNNQIIHIGYLSGDFRQHPVAFLMAEVIELHNRNQFKISAYSFGPNDNSDIRNRLENSFDNFVNIEKLSFEEAAKKIYQDHVDILIDLTGYTHNSRSAILALRPAPVQVNYLGYPGTMGADFVDYLIADKFVIPPEHQQHYTETVIRMPECFMPNDRTRLRLPPPSRVECGLPTSGFIFCCFNQTYKITPEIFDIWCRLLLAVPDSNLWLPASNSQAEKNLKLEAERRGVVAERIFMAAKIPQIESHLARLHCADLFLDTIPYNAHATCSDALWMGLPVITCVGETFPSRVAGSLLTAIGAPELVTYNLEDYYQLALELATNKSKLEAIRSKIIANRDTSPLFDSKRFTRNLEKAYIQMMDDYSKNSTP